MVEYLLGMLRSQIQSLTAPNMAEETFLLGELMPDNTDSLTSYTTASYDFVNTPHRAIARTMSPLEEEHNRYVIDD